MDNLTTSEQLKSPPTAGSRYIEWFTGDVIFLIIFAVINIALTVLFFKTRLNILTLNSSQNKNQTSPRQTTPREMTSIDSDDVQVPYNTQPQPIRPEEGMMD